MSFMHRVARQAAPHVHILLANFYLLFPPMVNPIIYGVKTKQIRERVLGLFLRKDVSAGNLMQAGFGCEALLQASVVAAHRLSSCGTCALAAPRHVESLGTKDRTRVPCIDRQEVTTVMNRAKSSVDIAKMAVRHLGLAALLRGVLYIGPLPIMIRLRLPLYRTQIITHSYCEHMAVVTLACGDTTVNNVYGMGIGFLVLILDSLAITASYVMIFRTVMGLATPEARLKTLGTCSSHICAILVFYIPIAVSSLTHRFGHHVPPHIHILLANFYLLIPPILNPVVYAVRTKQIRERLLHILKTGAQSK
ncbi:hypothetical protein JEQ12_006292 [Ovis aries]|uniref:G-protein coupled receptors family 1 profile domain-containing protein n=1 Tax=Ovis aries TaxID=9940 RepID=A0A835ZSD2_SHEEP|nr:hypothetical protein JEQ12_006292 [Ovis aries]